LSSAQTQEPTKKFYFQEINTIICFPDHGNRGKYCNYQVCLKSRETVSQAGKPAILGEFLDSPQVDNNYPHTVGYYKESTGEGETFQPEYLELRKIGTVEEFWLFLNASDL